MVQELQLEHADIRKDIQQRAASLSESIVAILQGQDQKTFAQDQGIIQLSQDHMLCVRKNGRTKKVEEQIPVAQMIYKTSQETLEIKLTQGQIVMFINGKLVAKTTTAEQWTEEETRIVWDKLKLLIEKADQCPELERKNNEKKPHQLLQTAAHIRNRMAEVLRTAKERFGNMS